jgi:hypothetical protein
MSPDRRPVARDAVLASQESLFNMWNLSMPGRHGLFSSESEKIYHLKGQKSPSCEGGTKEDDASSLLQNIHIRQPAKRASWSWDFDSKTCGKIM